MAQETRRQDLAEKGRFRRIQRDDAAPVYITPSGAEYVRASDVLKSKKGRKLVEEMANLVIQNK